jgi:hypothetical protein
MTHNLPDSLASSLDTPPRRDVFAVDDGCPRRGHLTNETLVGDDTTIQIDFYLRLRGLNMATSAELILTIPIQRRTESCKHCQRRHPLVSHHTLPYAKVIFLGAHDGSIALLNSSLHLLRGDSMLDAVTCGLG